MKLIITQPYLVLKGGAERVVLKIAQHYDAKIYTVEYDKDATFEGFKDIEIEKINKSVPLSTMLPYRASQGLRYGYIFYNLKIKDDYDLINAHISPSEWVRHKNSPVLWYCHTPPREVYDLYTARAASRSNKERILYAAMTSVYKIMANKIVKDIEQIATNSSTTQSRIERYFSRSAEVINPALDYEKYADNGDGKYFLYPSRIIPTKRQDYVIEAFSKFLKKSGNKDYKLIIAGALSKDPEHKRYYERLKQTKPKNTRFFINIGSNEMIKLYSRATAILFAAINEDFGYVPLEAMASKKPIIAVNEGGPRETIANNKTGFLVNSASEMAQKMQEIVENPSLAHEMGREGRKTVEKKYSWDAFFSKFDKLARKVAKSRSN